MPCRRASFDPHWCSEHKADFGEGARVCLAVLLDRVGRKQRVDKILDLLGAIDSGDTKKATGLGVQVFMAYEPLGL